MGAKCYSDRNYTLKSVPASLAGAILLQRSKDQDRAWLKGQNVKVSRNCNVYVAIMSVYNGKKVIEDKKFKSMSKRGWKFVSKDFKTTISGAEEWQVYSKKVRKGFVDLGSTQGLPGKTLIFMFK